MKTGFVVLTYNWSDALLAVLRALAAQCGPDEVVVLAAGGSRPDQVRALHEGLPRFRCAVRHVWHPDVGFTAARARNLGALHARSDYVVFLDGDCVPNPRFVFMHRRLAEQACSANASRVLLDADLSRRVAAGQVDPAALHPVEWLRLRLQGRANKLAHMLQWPGAPGRYERRFRWRGIRSANFGAWMRDLEAVNGFDEIYSGWGHEDADLVLRLHNAGRVRKNGFLATEVFHLWHTENTRAGEAANRDRVRERLASGLAWAQVGLAEASGGIPPVVTELNP